MKFLYSVILFVLFQLTFAQEQVVFYFDNNKFELNKVEAAKLQKWIAENTTSELKGTTVAARKEAMNNPR